MLVLIFFNTWRITNQLGQIVLTAAIPIHTRNEAIYGFLWAGRTTLTSEGNAWSLGLLLFLVRQERPRRSGSAGLGMAGLNKTHGHRVCPRGALVMVAMKKN